MNIITTMAVVSLIFWCGVLAGKLDAKYGREYGLWMGQQTRALFTKQPADGGLNDEQIK